MTYRGRIQNGQIKLEEAPLLPEGAEVRVEIIANDDARPTVWEKLNQIAGTAKGLPPDAAENHDHYLYGVPKKQ